MERERETGVSATAGGERASKREGWVRPLFSRAEPYPLSLRRTPPPAHTPSLPFLTRHTHLAEHVGGLFERGRERYRESMGQSAARSRGERRARDQQQRVSTPLSILLPRRTRPWTRPRRRPGRPRRQAGPGRRGGGRPVDEVGREREQRQGEKKRGLTPFSRAQSGARECAGSGASTCPSTTPGRGLRRRARELAERRGTGGRAVGVVHGPSSGPRRHREGRARRKEAVCFASARRPRAASGPPARASDLARVTHQEVDRARAGCGDRGASPPGRRGGVHWSTPPLSLGRRRRRPPLARAALPSRRCLSPPLPRQRSRARRPRPGARAGRRPPCGRSPEWSSAGTSWLELELEVWRARGEAKERTGK